MTRPPAQRALYTATRAANALAEAGYHDEAAVVLQAAVKAYQEDTET